MAQEAGKLGGVSHPISNLFSLEEALSGGADLITGQVGKAGAKFSRAAAIKISQKILDKFKNQDARLNKMYKMLNKLPSVRQYAGEAPSIMPLKTVSRENILSYQTKGLPSPKTVGGKPSGVRNVGGKPIITPSTVGGEQINIAPPYAGTNLPAIVGQSTPRGKLPLKQFKQIMKTKPQGQILRSKTSQVTPEQIIEKSTRGSQKEGILNFILKDEPIKYDSKGRLLSSNKPLKNQPIITAQDKKVFNEINSMSLHWEAGGPLIQGTHGRMIRSPSTFPLELSDIGIKFLRI
jgi:hypothetical protein